MFVAGTGAGWKRDSTLRCHLMVPIIIKLIRWRCMERGDSATITNLKKRKHFSQGIKKGYKKYLEQV